ncbi:hypothetical protein UNH65_07835 [Chitinophaga sp. 180180018-2]|nr:hypothetical protein [Chitinophaga sp. 212800010-3]
MLTFYEYYNGDKYNATKFLTMRLGNSLLLLFHAFFVPFT